MSRRRIDPRGQAREPEHNAATALCFGDSPFFTYEVAELDPGDLPALLLYFDAHRLLPPFYVFDGTERTMAVVADAMRALDRPGSDEEEVLRSLVILGHSPCPAAMEALAEWAGGDRPLADVARAALGECAGMEPILPVSVGALC